MANFDQETQRKTGFFHALGYVLTKKVNDPANEKYKSAHNVRTQEIWTDIINYVPSFNDAETEAASNDAVNQIGSETSGTASLALLYPLKDSDRQSWFLDTGTPTYDTNGFIPSSGWVKPMISPVDVTNAAGAPSAGFAFRLYDNTGTQISPLNGRWEVDYYSGLLKFNEGFTPSDTGNGLGFDFSASAFLTATDKVAFLQANGPYGVAFQYNGTYLDELLENLPSGGGSNISSNEWQDSVKSYLITVGTDTTVGGATSTDSQIDYLNDTYDQDYYIYTTTVDGGNTYSLTGSSWYYFDGTAFSGFTPSTADDDNRFLKVENSITLDVVEDTGTNSNYQLFEDTVISSGRIIELLGTFSTGLSQSGWEVTDPRVGMVTTLDDRNNDIVRYTGSTNEWVEYALEQTYKVNTQKDINSNLTQVDYDVAIDDTVQFEPSGDKSIDVLVNGVEAWSGGYEFAKPGVYNSFSSFTIIGTNSVEVPSVEAPTFSQYLRFDIGTGFKYRNISSVNISGSTATVGYTGDNVSAASNLDKFSVQLRGSQISQRGDLLLWKGSNFYELDNQDLLTLEYVTIDPSAQTA